MTALNRNSSDSSYAIPNKFQLIFPSLTSTSYFCTDVNIPGISSSSPTQATPFRDIPRAGDKLKVENLRIEFIVDQHLYSWEVIHDWMRGYTFPCDFAEYRNLKMRSQETMHSLTPQYSDAILSINSSQNNPIMEVKFIHAFPVSLSGLQFSTEKQGNEVIKAVAEFKYYLYNIRRINS